jgi:hypothetical protein
MTQGRGIYCTRTQVCIDGKHIERLWKSSAVFTWNTRGAETRLANADDNVADIMPAMVSGPNTDTSCITFARNTHFIVHSSL